MVVLWRGTETSRRAGFTVARQVRGSVSRNRARRRLREAYRRARHEAPAQVDLIVIGRPRALAVPMDSLIEDMSAAFRAIAHTQEKK
jgi:ribonuclease P protein component